LSLSTRIFNGVIIKCFFGGERIQEKVRGQSFDEYFNNSSLLLRDPVIFFFGKYAYRLGLSKTIRKTKEETAIFLAIAQQIRKRRSE
jgi:hypothetical protein